MKKISFRNDVLPMKDQIFRLALRITLNRAEAEDIVQDTLIKVWDNRDNWEQIESIEAYSFTIARNLSLDRIKKHDNQVGSLEDTETDDPDTSFNPYEQMIQKDRIALIKKLIDGLPEKQRSCMQLRDFEGKSYKEIVDILGISEEQVKVNIFRARQAIKQKYQEFDKYGL
jgi:RNA polymerase sigma-70 factor (ECF subfamily)